jgi:hypothetical protein
MKGGGRDVEGKRKSEKVRQSIFGILLSNMI